MSEPTQNTPQIKSIPSGLRPWQKGQSGNPGGRPKSRVLRALLEPHRRTMVAKLLLIMRSGENREALDAIKVMLSYTDGKPDSISPDEFSDDELLGVIMRRKEAQAEKQ